MCPHKQKVDMWVKMKCMTLRNKCRNCIYGGVIKLGLYMGTVVKHALKLNNSPCPGNVYVDRKLLLTFTTYSLQGHSSR